MNTTIPAQPNRQQPEPSPPRSIRIVRPQGEPVGGRCFDRWNGNPYLPDDGSTGRHEDAGADYLLPYWMGRFQGFIAEAQ